jgi:hypothetical protein
VCETDAWHACAQQFVSKCAAVTQLEVEIGNDAMRAGFTAHASALFVALRDVAHSPADKALSVVKHIEALLLAEQDATAATLFEAIRDDAALSGALRRELQEVRNDCALASVRARAQLRVCQVAWNHALKLYDAGSSSASIDWFARAEHLMDAADVDGRVKVTDAGCEWVPVTCAVLGYAHDRAARRLDERCCACVERARNREGYASCECDACSHVRIVTEIEKEVSALTLVLEFKLQLLQSDETAAAGVLRQLMALPSAPATIRVRWRARPQ